jgi:uncharacterized protein YegP (UPF0339 family)
MNIERASRTLPPDGGWRSGDAERQFLRRDGQGFAPGDPVFVSLPDDLDPESDSECRFEVFRADEQAMTSTLFSGGDWRWRLITSEGLLLAEAAGYPSERTCQAAVAFLQKRAASATVVAGRAELR